MKSEEKEKAQLKLQKELKTADAVAIFAGAGMGADGGLETYRGENGLWKQSIEVNNRKLHFHELMTHNAFVESPHKAWGLIAHLIEKYSNSTPHSGYSKLLDILKGKEYFVVTSNCDEHFLKAGFAEHKIIECHGSINYIQCLKPEEKEIWLTPKLDYNSRSLKAQNIPECPECGGNCRPNLLLFGDWFWVSKRSRDQLKKFQLWSKELKSTKKKIVALEIGAGKTLPTIRNAAERFAGESLPLFRINPFDSEVAKPNHFSLAEEAKEVILKL